MPEQQNIEYKTSWHDDYFKWICGFANNAWGRGIEKILDACREANLPEPQFEEHSGGMLVTLFRPQPVTPPVNQPVAPPVVLSVEVLLRILVETGEMGNAAIRNKLGLKDRAHVRERYLNPAIAEGFIELTIPDKPNSRLQKYRLTKKGVEYLKLKGRNAMRDKLSV